MSTLVHQIRIFFVFYARLHWTSVLQYYRTLISDIFRTIYLSQVNLFSIILSFYYNDDEAIVTSLDCFTVFAGRLVNRKFIDYSQKTSRTKTQKNISKE